MARFPPGRNIVHHLLKRTSLPRSIVLKDWNELGPLLLRLLSPGIHGGKGLANVDELQQTVLDWWFCFLKDRASRMEALMSANLVMD